MITLGIETSESPGSLALLNHGELMGEWPLARPGRRHAQTLVGEIDRRIKEFSLEPRQIDAVAVSLGPGSFTGLRVGVMCAKTWSFVTGCRLIGVGTYRAIACNAPEDVQRLFVIGDALQGDLYVGEFARDDSGHWQPIDKLTIESLTDWLSCRSAGEIVTGPGCETFKEELHQHDLVILGDEHAHPRAAWIARLGEQELARGNIDDWKGLVPIYLRRPAAEEKSFVRKTPFDP